MTDSRPTLEAGPTLSTDEVRKMFEELRSDFKNEIGSLRKELGLKANATQQNIGSLSPKVDAIQQSVTDLVEQAKGDRVLWKADQDNLAILSEDFNQYVLAKKIELPNSQSNGEDFPLDEPTSKEETILSINDKEPEVEAGEIMDNNPISKVDVVPQKDEREGWAEQSILEEEIGLNTDDDNPQFRMKGDQGASFPMRDVYVDTGQAHGGQGVVHLHSLIILEKQVHEATRRLGEGIG
ncbi:hypothetical protein ACLB2K_018989 [Fragaria x ananassa]